MQAPGWGAGDFDLGLSDIFGCINDVLEHVSHAVASATAGGQTTGGKSAGRRERGGHGEHGPKGGGSWLDWQIPAERSADAGAQTGQRGFGGHAGRAGRGHWGGGAGGAWGGWWPGGPPGPPGPPGSPGRPSKAGRGDVRAAILALLREGPRTGYQIMSEISERSGGAWRPSPGAVYPALSQLADEGLIAGEESGGRRTFSLTEAGLAYLEKHPEMARAAWESRQQQEAWELPGLFAEAARLGGGIVQVTHSGTPEQVHAVERLLARTRRELYQILADDFDPEGNDDDGAGAGTDPDEPGHDDKQEGTNV
jgi:DNA-binding PadR family transcriptional regulator